MNDMKARIVIYREGVQVGILNIQEEDIEALLDLSENRARYEDLDADLAGLTDLPSLFPSILEALVDIAESLK